MHAEIRALLDGLQSDDGDVRYSAYNSAMAITGEPVDWAYEAWDELLAMTRHPGNHQRAIATQLLCNLAISDPERRIMRDFDMIMAVTRDAKFVTARHTLQALWRVGLAGGEQRRFVASMLAGRFRTCAGEKNYMLIRHDIVEGLRKLYDATQDDEVKATALELVASEQDEKYRKKYATLWRKA
jgi:hypothetical protein